MRSVPIIAAAAASALLANAQAAPRPAPHFDVVSVKIDRTQGPGARVLPGFVSPDTWVAGRVSVATILSLAFQTPRSEMAGLPSWAGDTLIDIEAKLPADASRQELPAMLQSMLADRFQLVTHRATLPTNVRWIEVAKGGAKLQPARIACTDDASVPREDTCCRLPRFAACYLGVKVPSMDCAHPPPTRCGDVVRFSDYPNYQYGVDFAGLSASMADLARALNDLYTGSPWVDHTGLKGKYDFIVKADLTPLPEPPGSTPAPLDMDYEIERAFHDQAGLDLRPSSLHKQPFPMLVIDRISPPSAN